MTAEQREMRDERVAIMTVEGLSEEEAHAWCNTIPETFGTVNLQKAANSRI